MKKTLFFSFLIGMVVCPKFQSMAQEVEVGSSLGVKHATTEFRNQSNLTIGISYMPILVPKTSFSGMALCVEDTVLGDFYGRDLDCIEVKLGSNTIRMYMDLADDNPQMLTRNDTKMYSWLGRYTLSVNLFYFLCSIQTEKGKYYNMRNTSVKAINKTIRKMWKTYDEGDLKVYIKSRSNGLTTERKAMYNLHLDEITISAIRKCYDAMGE